MFHAPERDRNTKYVDEIKFLFLFCTVSLSGSGANKLATQIGNYCQNLFLEDFDSL